VKEKAAVSKSMLASKNLQKPITSARDGPHWIRVLAAELALRLREAREATPGLWPKTIVSRCLPAHAVTPLSAAHRSCTSGAVRISAPHAVAPSLTHTRAGYQLVRSKQAAFPFVRDCTVDTIAGAGARLWDALVPQLPTPLRITNVQLSFSGIEAGPEGQQQLHRFFAAAPAPAPAPAEPAASGGAGELKRKLELPAEPGEAPRDDVAALAHDDSTPTHADVGFVCARCNQRIQLPADAEHVDADVAVAKLRL
jgi:DNA polymerase eta